MSVPIVDVGSIFERSVAPPALCIGRGATSASGDYTAVREAALAAFLERSAVFEDLARGRGGDFSALMDDLLIRDPEAADLLRRLLILEIRKLQPPLDLNALARANWSACISLTEDLGFESALRNYYDSRPQSLALTVVDAPGIAVPPRSLPLYKLLGNIEATLPNARLAVSGSELMVRMQGWSGLLRSCADFSRDAPLLFVGTHVGIDLTRSLLSLLSTSGKPSFSRLIFLRQDSPLDDPTVRALCAGFEVQLVDATVRELCSAMAERPRQRAISSVGTAGVPKDLKASLESLAHFASVVPNHQPVAAEEASHLPQLVDALFRPSSIDWEPFLRGLDLQRSIAEPIASTIASRLASRSTGPFTALIRGDAAAGKTTLMKNVAVNVSRHGVLTLWCRRSLLGNWTRAFKEFCRELGALPEAERKGLKLAVFCDDPWQMRIDASELLRCFDGCPCPIVFVFAMRNSDHFASGFSEPGLGIRADEEFELGFELDEAEQASLKTLLVRLGIAADDRQAIKLVSSVHSSRAADILCSLWYLVPETRFQLSESLRDEYCRLGEAKDRIAEVAQYAGSSSAIARRAYEFVTVTSSLGIGLPLEVLVRALEIQYEEWLEMTKDGRPLWGLLYDDDAADGQTILFWTRNEIVNKVLLELVNGGIATRAGEVRVLRDLIAACKGGSLLYREFVVEILVRARGKLESRLSYAQGLELFKVAQEALPHQDRVLEHHKGIWMQRMGGPELISDAYAQLGRALEAPIYPGSERDARREHIHTSMAAAVVDMVKEGKMNEGAAIELVQDHARQSSNPNFFNPHSAHVVASLFFELSKRANDNAATADAAIGTAEALSEISRALQAIGTSARARSHYEKDIVMLGDLQRRVILSLPQGEDLSLWASDIFSKTGQQVGFEAAARKLLDGARGTGKGSDFNNARLYLESVEALLRDSGKAPSPELHVLFADLQIGWRLERVAGPINWESLLRHIDAALQGARYRDDAILNFYKSVCLFHLGRFTDASAMFSALRRKALSGMSPGEHRCCFRGSEGMPRRVQGTLEHKHGQHYLFIQELGLSVLSQRPDAEGGHGATTHGYIVFALNGPLAVYRRPEH